MRMAKPTLSIEPYERLLRLPGWWRGAALGRLELSWSCARQRALTDDMALRVYLDEEMREHLAAAAAYERKAAELPEPPAGDLAQERGVTVVPINPVVETLKEQQRQIRDRYRDPANRGWIR